MITKLAITTDYGSHHKRIVRVLETIPDSHPHPNSRDFFCRVSNGQRTFLRRLSELQIVDDRKVTS